MLTGRWRILDSMRILVLGGTQFIGRHIVEHLCAANHATTILNRGQKASPTQSSAGTTRVEHLIGDRDLGAAGLTALATQRWDACVDVSGYTPLQVRASTTLLRDCVRHYVYMSTASVYAPGAALPAKENTSLLPTIEESVTEITEETYGRLKATCEGIVREQFGDRMTILRPQIVVGPHDHTGRYMYWVDRVARGGTILGPGDGTDPLQVVDVRDLARFTVRCLEYSLTDVFNVAGFGMRWSEFLGMLGASDIAWVSTTLLERAGVDFRSLPLFRAGSAKDAHGSNMSTAKAEAAGFTRTAPELTLRDVREWAAMTEHPIPPDIAAELLSRARERELIAGARGGAIPNPFSG
jgi:2'-hydroxyisoflavone reductase